MGIKIWLDGGWGVDALLKQQTRTHDDLDIIVQEQDLPNLRNFFDGLGYKAAERDDTRAWNFVLTNSENKEVDVHVININAQGDGIYGPAKNGQFYPANSLTAKGEIDGLTVNCLTAEYQLISHCGYKLREKDFHDVNLLCNTFDLPLPKEYE